MGGASLPSMPSHPKAFFGGVGMFKGKFVVLTLVVAAMALSISMMPGANVAYSGIVSATNSTATTAGAACWLIDPVGQGDRLDALGSVISIVAKDNSNNPIADIPATDFWLIGATDAICLCGGSASSNADSVSNSAGETTISGALRGGGYDAGVQVVIQSTVVMTGGNPTVLPLTAVSPDLDCDLAVDSPDFAVFGIEYIKYPGTAVNMDFNCDTLVELIDFTLFAQHFLRVC
jgi:hypothetical protein